MNPAERAAYRALARFRIPSAEREAFAGEVVAMLAGVPADLLPRGTEEHNESWGVTCELARRALRVMPSVPSVRMSQVAGAAVSAAAQVMLETTGGG